MPKMVVIVLEEKSKLNFIAAYFQMWPGFASNIPFSESSFVEVLGHPHMVCPPLPELLGLLHHGSVCSVHRHLQVRQIYESQEACSIT